MKDGTGYAQNCDDALNSETEELSKGSSVSEEQFDLHMSVQNNRENQMNSEQKDCKLPLNISENTRHEIDKAEKNTR